tara:strand:- start:217 stop:489 length:273 start_codon:yes stop_codon:yes gene_type:complete
MSHSRAQIAAKKTKAPQKPLKKQSQQNSSSKISPLQRRYGEALIAAAANDHECDDICENNPYGCVMVGFGEVSLENCQIAVDRHRIDDFQ